MARIQAALLLATMRRGDYAEQNWSLGVPRLRRAELDLAALQSAAVRAAGSAHWYSSRCPSPDEVADRFIFEVPELNRVEDPRARRVDPDGPHGDGIGYLLPIRVRVSYPDLDRTDAVLTAGDDGDDLWQMLEHAHLEIVGMLPLHYEGREPYRWHTLNDEERALVFDFAIELPFLGSDQFQTHQD